MLFCLKPDCFRPNPDDTRFCQSCGNSFLLNDRYRCLRSIGQGGFGRTYLVEDQQRRGAKAVVKQFFPDPALPITSLEYQEALRLFDQEADRLLQLEQHPQVPVLFDCFEQEGCRYLVQQFIDGPNLKQELEQQGQPFTESQIQALLQDLLPVLQFIHQHNIIHRDIKPENIIRRLSDQRPVLVDFGAAKVATQTTLARTGTKLSSLGFTSPEQEAGRADFVSDVYSLGATCLYLLTQQNPIELWDYAKDHWAWREMLQSLANPISIELTRTLDRMVERAMAKRLTVTQVLQRLKRKRGVQSSLPQVISTTAPLPLAPTKVILKTVEFKVVTVNAKGRPGAPVVVQSQNFLESLNRKIKLEMVAIPGGSFKMGSPNTESGRLSNEGPLHPVTVTPFFISQYPITQEQWAVVAALPKVNLPLDPDPSYFKGAKLPVEQVSWDDTWEFCERLHRKTGRDYRLPSEAEWEYACRAGTLTPFHFGPTLTAAIANYDASSTYGFVPKGEYRQQTTEVGLFPPNAFGLYDMHGNVWEWCADSWHKNYLGAPADGRVWERNGSTQYRLLRGGAWNSSPRQCRAANRNGFDPSCRNSYIGFRVVCI